MNNRRRHVTSIIVVLVAIAALVGVILVKDLEPRLGLDLRGGLSVTLTAPAGTQPDVLEKTVSILRERVDAAGVAEPEISREGRNNVLIQLPGATDRERLLRLIGRTAQLQFRQVKELIPPGTPEFASATVTPADDVESDVVLAGKETAAKLRLGPAELTGDDVRRGSPVVDPSNGQWTVSLKLTSAGSKKWETFTGRLACEQGPTRQIAIVLDERVESSPEVAQEVACNQGIKGDTSISGTFTQQEAKDLALVLTTGALPVKLERSEVRTVSPTLGSDSLRAGLLAGALGLALVLLYVLIYYRALGLQTWIGLLAFAIVLYGLVVVFGALIGWSLTLAGIAGLIVSVGIATDSYIVFFERVKEEIHQGRSLAASIDRGFKHAWRTMFTANMVTILAAIVLYLLAVGSVRGFALSLGLATALDLGLTYLFTWPLAALLARSRFFAENPLLGMRRALEGRAKKEGEASSLLRKIGRSEFNIDFIGRRKLWLLGSAVVLIISIVALVPAVRGLEYGIDFKGGTLFRVPLEDDDLAPSSVADRLTQAGIRNPVVQIAKDLRGRAQLEVQTEPIRSPEQLSRVSALIAESAGADLESVDTDSVGEKWGQQVTTKALRALGIFLILAIAYMSWRLEPKMAAAGIAALLHDLVITAGIYALVGFEVSPATVIATLTILGFSLYDTIVVFDKVRENQAAPANARKSFAEIANDSINQVFMRSINTSLTVLIPVGSLLFVGSALLGADTLKDLALALFVGIAAGAYSSIFTAPPLLSIWKQNEPRYSSIRSKVVREAVLRSGDGVRAAPATAGSKASSAATPSPTPAPSGTAQSGARPMAARNQRKKQSRSKRKKTRR